MIHRFSRLRMPLAALASVSLLTGCTDDGTGPRAGAWQALVSGSVHRSLVGFATFGTVASDDGDGDFIIELLADDRQPTVLIEFRSPRPERPSSGVFSVGTAPSAAGVTVTFLQLESGGLTGSLHGQNGTVTIQQSVPGRVSGEFDFTATGYLSVDGVLVPDARLEVAGAFSAIEND